MLKKCAFINIFKFEQNLPPNFFGGQFSISSPSSLRSPEFYPRSDRGGIAGQGEGLFAAH